MYEGCERALAVNHMWRGEVATARDAIESLLALADERGEAESYYALRVQLCELELRAGRFDVVLRLLGEWAREPELPVGGQAALLRCRALLAGRRGDATACAKLAAEAIAQADAAGVQWQRLEALRALGLAALLSGDAPGACQIMRQVWEHLVREGIENPGAFPVAPDFVDALTRAGELDEAGHVVDRLAAQARAHEHPWGAAAAKRAEGQLLLARGDHASAADALAEAAAEFQELELPFDRARSLLGLGIAQRLLRRRRDARGSLEEAAKSFRRLDAAGWADAVDGELGRISGRRESGQRLTSTEQRVAELVAQGLANKQIASRLVVSVGTVEAHLTRIYAKLGVRSRTELVRVISDPQPG
jgi:DNA-binding CsgD family transcriptional regulator